MYSRTSRRVRRSSRTRRRRARRRSGVDFDSEVKDDRPMPGRLKSNGKRAHDRRDEIVRSAAAVLRRGRDGALRMEEVAKQVGLVKGNLYYYFKDRQELIFHCHMRCTEMSLAALEEVAARDGSAEERLREFLQRHIEIIIASDYGGALLADIGELTAAQRRRYVAL